MLQKKIWAFPVLLSVVHGVVAEAKNMVGRMHYKMELL